MTVTVYGVRGEPGEQDVVFDPRDLDIPFPNIEWNVPPLFPSEVEPGEVAVLAASTEVTMTVIGAFDALPNALNYSDFNAYFAAVDAWETRNATVPVDSIVLAFEDPVEGPVVVTLHFTGDDRGAATDVVETWTWSTVEALNPEYGGDTIPVDGIEVNGGESADNLLGSDGADSMNGHAGDDRMEAGNGDDLVFGGSGRDTLIGGSGNDTLIGGDDDTDLRDVIYGGEGADSIEGGYGNDELRGDAGNDSLSGGFGADSLFGGDGDDQLSGGALSDLIYGGAGNDFLNGGFGYDRLNGGDGADRFFHLGISDHGSDWIQDYDASEGDVLVFGQAGATPEQFQLNIAETPNAGQAGVAEAFVVYRPTGQIIWALVDGVEQSQIMLQLGSTTYDLVSL